MAHLEVNSPAALAFVRANARKFLDGKKGIWFNNILQAAYKNGMVTSEELALKFNVKAEVANNWTSVGKEPNKPGTQRRIIQYIFDKCPS
jgi:hypothetical protein